MAINWFTFVAQLANFVILLVLLQRFLYGPIAAAMTAREARLTARFQEAEAARAEAESEAARLAAERAALAKEREETLAAVAAEADERRSAMLAAVRAEVEEMASRWYDGVERQQAAFKQSMRERIEAEVLHVSQRALSDLANGSLEAQVADVFADRLLNLSAQDRQDLIKAGAGFGEDVVIRSAFDLPDAQRQHLVDALQQAIYAGMQMERPGARTLPPAIGVRFEQKPDLICGIELEVRSRRVAWSVRDYLDKLNVDLLEAVEMGT